MPWDQTDMIRSKPLSQINASGDSTASAHEATAQKLSDPRDTEEIQVNAGLDARVLPDCMKINAEKIRKPAVRASPDLRKCEYLECTTPGV